MTSLSEEEPNEVETMTRTTDTVILSEEDIELAQPTFQRYKPQKKVCKGYFRCSLLIVLQCLCIVVLVAILIYNNYFSDPATPSNSLLPSQNRQEQSQTKTQSNRTTENPKRPTVAVVIPDKNEAEVETILPVKAEETNNSAPKTQPKQQQQAAAQPRDRQRKDKNPDFNLWDLSPTLKASLLRRFKALPPEKKPKKTDNFMEINLDKNQDFEEFAKKFEEGIEVIDWSSIDLTPHETEKMSYDYEFALKERLQKLERMIGKYKAEYMGKSGFIQQAKEITYQQFLDNMEYQTLTGQDFRAKPELERLYKREREYFQDKFKVNQYKNELHACVIAPTYLNDVDFRYAWHLESIFQQEYANFRVIIIDDASSDKTSEKIARHLRWRDFPKEKAILIRSKVHRTALQNIYYAVHKYCDYNQIFYIVDGDDELAGTQAFRLYNAIYQQQKLYVLYSNYLDYDSKNVASPVRVGLSQSYPESALRQSNYRTNKHAYSHLRTMMSDLFLLQRVQSFKDSKGKFYWTIYDNAMYFPALEMSCGRVKYIPEQLYWYTSNTGMNDWRTTKQREYSEVKLHIQNTQKHYQCINNVFKTMKSALEGGS